MKKIIAMAMVMLLVLAACGESTPEQTLPQTSTTVSTTAAPTTEATEAETAPVETAAPETEPVEAAALEAKLTLGTVENYTYINESIGMVVTLDEKYQFATVEDIIVANGVDPTMSEQEITEAMYALETVKMMQMVNEEAQRKIMILAHKAEGRAQELILAEVTQDMTDEATAQGATVTCERVGAQFSGGTEQNGNLLVAAVSGGELYCFLCVYEVADYTISLSLVATDMENLNELIGTITIG